MASFAELESNVIFHQVLETHLMHSSDMNGHGLNNVQLISIDKQLTFIKANLGH
jgi:hypothetical protein